jgi:hypothetical protein
MRVASGSIPPSGAASPTYVLRRSGATRELQLPWPTLPREGADSLWQRAPAARSSLPSTHLRAPGAPRNVPLVHHRPIAHLPQRGARARLRRVPRLRQRVGRRRVRAAWCAGAARAVSPSAAAARSHGAPRRHSFGRSSGGAQLRVERSSGAGVDPCAGRCAGRPEAAAARRSRRCARPAPPPGLRSPRAPRSPARPAPRRTQRPARTRAPSGGGRPRGAKARQDSGVGGAGRRGARLRHEARAAVEVPFFHSRQHVL